MACSKAKFCEEIQFKCHYKYHSDDRCTSIVIDYGILTALCLKDFCEYLQNEIPYLQRLPLIRACYRDDEGHWVDIDERNYFNFINAGQRINIKILDARSPAPDKTYNAQHSGGQCATSKRQLNYNTESNCDKLVYKSPMEMDLDLKENEIKIKDEEFKSYCEKYEDLHQQYNPSIPKSSRKLCHNCHAREGHSKAKCPNLECQNILECGEIDLHPDCKKELQELANLKNKTEADLKKLRHEYDTKKKIYGNMSQTFESKIHSALINSNPEKYLIGGTGPGYKKRLLDVDKCILRKHYKGKAPKNVDLESHLWKSIIETHHAKFEMKTVVSRPPRNPVLERMKTDMSKSKTIDVANNEQEQLNQAIKLSLLEQSPAGVPSNQLTWNYPYMFYPPYAYCPSIGPTTPAATSTTSMIQSPQVGFQNLPVFRSFSHGPPSATVTSPTEEETQPPRPPPLPNTNTTPPPPPPGLPPGWK